MRISITDRCNFRCIYCMPLQGLDTSPREKILSFEEIERVVRIFASLGVKHIRLTGGEPLMRKAVDKLIKSISTINGIEDLSLTTNGSLLKLYAESLREAGLKRINISLDTLNREKFKYITRCDSFTNVIKGIEAALRAEFHPVKLNNVVMKGINDEEIIDFIKFSIKNGVWVRFIEYMRITPLWERRYFFPMEEVKKICEKNFTIEKIGRMGPGPAVYYKVENSGIIGFIKTHIENCLNCKRLRLTSTGELKNCLYLDPLLNLKNLLRKKLKDEEIKKLIKKAIRIKKVNHFKHARFNKVYMCKIGG